MKKIFALMVVASLGAIGCDKSGSTKGSKTDATTGGTVTKVKTSEVKTDATVTNTIVNVPATVLNTNTKVVTKEVTVGETKKTPDGPAIPEKK